MNVCTLTWQNIIYVFLDKTSEMFSVISSSSSCHRDTFSSFIPWIFFGKMHPEDWKSSCCFYVCGDLNIYSLSRLKHDPLYKTKREENHTGELKRERLCANLDKMAHYHFFIVPPVCFLCHFVYSVGYFSCLHAPKNSNFCSFYTLYPLHSFDAIVTLDHISGLSELEPHVWHSLH